MDIGTTLRIARERHGLTLTQLAARTKIPVGILQALEQNAFDRVPRGIFVRGFLRAYACEVGLDPGETVSQFRSESGEVVSSASEAQAVPTRAIEDDIDPAQIDPDLTASGTGWGYVLVIAALLVAVVSINRSNAPDDLVIVPVSRGEDGVQADERTSAGSAVQPVATTGQGLPALASAGFSTLRFDIETQAPCWVEAVVDGRRLVYRLMLPGERQTLESAREIVLRVGDPAALTYSINGTTGEPLGRAGIPVTVRFTNGGERTTLAS
jgi:cytoskeleton protein RodZ